MNKMHISNSDLALDETIATVEHDLAKLRDWPDIQQLLANNRDVSDADLEASIMASGGVREPIIIWGNRIIDGHRRVAIAANLGYPVPYIEMMFKNESDAIEWVAFNTAKKQSMKLPKVAGLHTQDHQALATEKDSAVPPPIFHLRENARYRTDLVTASAESKKQPSDIGDTAKVADRTFPAQPSKPVAFKGRRLPVRKEAYTPVEQVTAKFIKDRITKARTRMGMLLNTLDELKPHLSSAERRLCDQAVAYLEYAIDRKSARMDGRDIGNEFLMRAIMTLQHDEKDFYSNEPSEIEREQRRQNASSMNHANGF